MLLWLNLFVVTVIHLTSSQSTYDCQHHDDVMSQLSQIATAISKLQKDVEALSQLESAMWPQCSDVLPEGGKHDQLSLWQLR